MTWPKSMILAFTLAVSGVGFLSLGCASSGTPGTRETTMWLPDQDGANQAPGAAYAADSMMFRKPMPSRPDWRPMEFYFKDCQSLGEASYYSKTSYECSAR